jgi:hypothetical protein
VTETIEPMSARIDRQQLASNSSRKARAEGVGLVAQGRAQRADQDRAGPALEAQLSEHVGYDKHDPSGRTARLHGTRAEDGRSPIGPPEIKVPRGTRRHVRAGNRAQPQPQPQPQPRLGSCPRHHESRTPRAYNSCMFKIAPPNPSPAQSRRAG